jgi:protein-disulfide isomerase
MAKSGDCKWCLKGDLMAKKDTKGKQTKPTKREAVREKRRQEQRRRRMYIVLAIVGGALAIAAIIVVPSLLPVGDVVTITPVERPMADGRAMGDPDAPVTIEVFEDFQCSACKTYSEQIAPQVKDAYVATGEVYYIFRHFPFLDDNAPRKESDQAANASMCAGDENRFWDYHDMLFANWKGENQGSFNDRRLVAFAEALGLDMGQFNSCFDANLHAEEINSDLQQGRDMGVSGTPSVLVNGRILTPGRVPSFTDISEAVEAELAASGN